MIPLPTNDNHTSLVPESSATHEVPASLEFSESSNVSEDSRVRPEKESVFKKTVAGTNNSNVVIKPSAKNQAKQKKTDISTINISELNLGKDIECRLTAAGYMTVQDLLPNGSISDLAENKMLNRKSRREIEARLKQRKIPIR